MSKLLGSHLVANELDDDTIRGLIHCIEELAEKNADEYGITATTEKTVEWAADGDYFLTYQFVRGLLSKHYPDIYGLRKT